MKDLGCISNAQVIQRFVSLEGKRVVDVGCGSLTFSRQLADLGARVLAIDPDAEQAKVNREAEPVPNICFVESGAEQIPAADRSVDGVFFAYSLHHIPATIYLDVFDEVGRVLKPDGFLYVIEPIDCPLNQVMKLFYDEDAQRTEAWQALIQLAQPRFESIDEVTYHGFTQYESFKQFADRFADQAFDSIYSADDVRRPEVEEAFYRLGHPNLRFQSPKNAMVLKGIKYATT